MPHQPAVRLVYVSALDRPSRDKRPSSISCRSAPFWAKARTISCTRRTFGTHCYARWPVQIAAKAPPKGCQVPRGVGGLSRVDDPKAIVATRDPSNGHLPPTAHGTTRARPSLRRQIHPLNRRSFRPKFGQSFCDQCNKRPRFSSTE